MLGLSAVRLEAELGHHRIGSGQIVPLLYTGSVRAIFENRGACSAVSPRLVDGGSAKARTDGAPVLQIGGRLVPRPAPIDWVRGASGGISHL